jgi:hypothetical protein
MDFEMQQTWDRLLESVSVQQHVNALAVGIQLLLAGLSGVYLRWLYRHCSASASDPDGIARGFPLLMVITTAVIGIVKTSLAMSIGFAGSLALIRFRAAIKEPEELVYVFLCVAVGLAFGAEVPLLALLLLVAASVLALGMHVQRRRGTGGSLLLTITGDADSDFGDGDSSVFSAVSDLAVPHTLQRLDLENGRGQIRLILRRTDERATATLITQLKRRLPNCEFSFVNLNSSL